jgi:hypothetical protein
MRESIARTRIFRAFVESQVGVNGSRKVAGSGKRDPNDAHWVRVCVKGDEVQALLEDDTRNGGNASNPSFSSATSCNNEN